MYTDFGLTLSDQQKRSVANAMQKNTGVKLRLNSNQLDGQDKLALTATQIKHITKAQNTGKGVRIALSKSQLQKMMKSGGFLPLLLAGLGALGALAGGASAIAKTVHEKQTADATLAEQTRHNQQVEKELRGSGFSKSLTCCPQCRGSGLYLSKNR
jgi:hypothetical protein